MVDIPTQSMSVFGMREITTVAADEIRNNHLWLRLPSVRCGEMGSKLFSQLLCMHVQLFSHRGSAGAIGLLVHT